MLAVTYLEQPAASKSPWNARIAAHAGTPDTKPTCKRTAIATKRQNLLTGETTIAHSNKKSNTSESIFT